MNKSFKFPQLLLTVMAAIGMFLPLVTVKANNMSDSISFFKVDTDGKIIFGLIVVAVILLLFKNENNMVLGIVALLFITGAGVYFWSDMSKVADGMTYVKIFSGEAIHYGIGYYMTLIGLIISFILGVVELILGNTRNKNRVYEYVDIPQVPNNQNSAPNQYVMPTNTALNQSMNNQNNMINNQNQISNTPYKVINDIKLSDLVNRNNNINTENGNNGANIEKPINDINNNSN